MGAEEPTAEDEGRTPAVAEGEEGKENLDALKVEELKERCRSAGLKVSGSKAELVARLKEHSSSSSSKAESKPEAEGEKDEAKEESKEEGKEDAKEAKGDSDKAEEAKETEAAKESPEEDGNEEDLSAPIKIARAKDDSKEEKQEDMLAEDAEEASPSAKAVTETKAATEASPCTKVDIDSDAEDAKEPPQKVAKTDQEDRKASSPAPGNRRSRSGSSGSGSRKGDHRKEAPSKSMGNPEDREKARQGMNQEGLDRPGRPGGRTGGRPGGKSLDRSRRGLKDSDVEKILEEHDQDEYGYTEINLSKNSIGNVGIEHLVGILKKCPDLKILKLFSNQVDDDGARKLAEMFQHCKGIEEIHLSHNKFTAKGVELMVEAADEELPKEFPRPLWLRMEHNDIKDPKECVDNIESKFKSVCPREDRYKCLPRACVKNCRIHLPFLVDRDREGDKGGGKGGKGKGGDRDRGGSWRDNDRWGRNRSPPRRRSPPRQNNRQSYRDEKPRGRYNDRSRSRSPRGYSPPPRRDRAPAQDTRGRQQHGGGRGRGESPVRRPAVSRYESQRATLAAAQRGSREPPGAYQRVGGGAPLDDDEYSYEYTDESVEPPPGRGQHQDNGRGRGAGGARVPPRGLPPRDSHRGAQPRSAYHGSSVRMGGRPPR